MQRRSFFAGAIAAVAAVATGRNPFTKREGKTFALGYSFSKEQFETIDWNPTYGGFRSEGSKLYPFKAARNIEIPRGHLKSTFTTFGDGSA